MCYTSERVCELLELGIISVPQQQTSQATQHKNYGLKHNEHRPGSYMITVLVKSIATIEACHTTCEVVSISSYMLLDESAL